ncbi:unnamed protein product [Allacma fusca]|uniref:Uncharacterized protein n=1 Tax=Allacma fusca TaxID=39272 RepID=A0A8J2NXN0_9HEXA|nr:unnamed protein product [Allacma fusca]
MLLPLAVVWNFLTRMCGEEKLPQASSAPGSCEPERLPRPMYLGRGLPNRSVTTECESLTSTSSQDSKMLESRPSGSGRGRILGKMQFKKDQPLVMDEKVGVVQSQSSMAMVTPSQRINPFLKGRDKPLEGIVNGERKSCVVNGDGGEESMRRRASGAENINHHLPRGMGMKGVEAVYDRMMRRHAKFESEDEVWDD